MNETAIWLVAGGGSGAIAFITFWMTMATRMTEARAVAEAAEARAKNAEHMASIATAELSIVRREINTDRVEMSSKLAGLEAVTRNTSQALAQAETRLAKSLEDMASKIDHLGDTLVRTLSEILAQGRTVTFSRREPPQNG